MMNLVEENDRLIKLFPSAATGGDSNSIRQIQQSLKTKSEALEGLAAESRRQADATNRLAEERSKNQVSKINRQRWLTGIAVSLLVILAYQMGLGRGRPQTDNAAAA